MVVLGSVLVVTIIIANARYAHRLGASQTVTLVIGPAHGHDDDW